MLTFVGIDPGLSGAIAVVVANELGALTLVSVNDMPVEESPGKGKVRRRVSAPALGAMLDMIGRSGVAGVFVESVASMPGQGVASMFSLGDSSGVVRATCAMLGMPVSYVLPQQWKRHFRLLGSDKAASRTRVLELFPSRHELFARSKDHGRAEAVLIACYGSRLWNGGER